MMKTTTSLIALGTAATMLTATPAAASQQEYRIDSNSESTINMDICSSSVEVYADGDNDTDLDFWIYDNNGNLVHTDTDSTDLTYYTVQSNAGNGRCLPYRLKVKNYGDVYNNMQLRLTDQGSGGGGQTGIIPNTGGGGGRIFTNSVRADSNSNQTHTINLCAPSVYMEVRGDGDTDLDFWVYDERGNQVHEDTDSTDITFATLRSGRSYGNCVNYSLRIRNYGDVYNNVEIKLTEQ